MTPNTCAHTAIVARNRLSEVRASASSKTARTMVLSLNLMWNKARTYLGKRVKRCDSMVVTHMRHYRRHSLRGSMATIQQRSALTGCAQGRMGLARAISVPLQWRCSTRSASIDLRLSTKSRRKDV